MARRFTEDEYAEMAADFEANPPTAEEIGTIEVNPAILRNGRPPKSAPARGKTPTMSVRLPTELRAQLEVVAKEENATTAEVIRRAVGEYVQRRSTRARGLG